MQRAIRRLAASAAAGVAGAAGIAMLALGSGSLAQASTCSGGLAGGCYGITTASVSVAASTTIIDSTPSIAFTAPASLPGNATNSPVVNLVVSSNDASGYTVVLAAASSATNPSGSTSPTGLTGSNGGSIPYSGLSVVGSASPMGSDPQPFKSVSFGGGWTPNNPFWGVLADDAGSGPSAGSGDAIQDTFSLAIPNVIPGTYSGILEYVVAGI